MTAHWPDYALSATRGETPPTSPVGCTEPRLWTPPLRPLTPETSYGFDLIQFAEDIGTPFDPWQRWLSIHVGELLPDGRPRFRTAVVLVARQNGKTLWARTLILYWLYIEHIALVLGTSTDRQYAKRAWKATLDYAQAHDVLKWETGIPRLTIGEESMPVLAGKDDPSKPGRRVAEYVFAANNGAAARSLTVHRWLCDEVREHKDLACWNAASNAMNAVRDAQIIAVSNQGDDGSVLLDMLRDPAEEYITSGVGDPRLGLFEWSAPAGCEPTDLIALAQANPNLGHRLDPDALIAAGRRAATAGGIELAGHRTEVLCQRVQLLDPAVDPELWAAGGTDDMPDLADYRRSVACVLDVSLAGDHATLVAAAEIDGVTYADVVRAWAGPGCTTAVRADLPGIIGTVQPRVIGWLPSGPAAELTADLTAKPRAGWPPRGVKLVEITNELPAVCMALPGLLRGGQLKHNRDPLLAQHVSGAQRLYRVDRWVFGRRGRGPVDGLYALAGAVHLARTLPPPPPPLATA